MTDLFKKKKGSSTAPSAKIAAQMNQKPSPNYASPSDKPYASTPSSRAAAQQRYSSFRYRMERIASKKEGLELALRENNIKQSGYEFVRRMFFASIIVAIILGIAIFVLFYKIVGLSIIYSLLLGVILAFLVARIAFENFLNFPFAKGKKASKEVDKGILFAARDMIISLRSGMPLFNAITSVSVGYGETSKEFAKIVESVQLGKPLEQSIDEAIAKTKSTAFKRLMLQASVSIKAGSEVVTALQTILDQLAQERVIELRRYGQKLNAVAMFYMLFGIIMPSMGIAVITILTTFISIFTVTNTVLIAALVFLAFMQIVFLKLSGARPVFSM